MPIAAGSNVVSLIGAPTDIGASVRGASMGPEALRVAQIEPALERHGLEVIDHGNLNGPPNPWLPPVDGYRHLDEVVAWNRLVHEAVGAELAAAAYRSCSGVTTALRSVRSVRWHATAASGASVSGFSGSMPTRTSTPMH